MRNRLSFKASRLIPRVTLGGIAYCANGLPSLGGLQPSLGVTEFCVRPDKGRNFHYVRFADTAAVRRAPGAPIPCHTVDCKDPLRSTQ